MDNNHRCRKLTCMYGTIHPKNSHCLAGYTDRNNLLPEPRDLQWVSMSFVLHSSVVAYNTIVPSMHCFLLFLPLFYVRLTLLYLNMVPNDEEESYVLNTSIRGIFRGKEFEREKRKGQ